jgi:SRSO17 transposase
LAHYQRFLSAGAAATREQFVAERLRRMLARGPVVAWVVDDTSFPKKGQTTGSVMRSSDMLACWAGGSYVFELAP